MRRAGEVVGGIGRTAGLCLLVLGIVFYPSQSTAKSAIAAPFPFSPPAKKTLNLSYPGLPGEISDRILGIKRKALPAQPRLDSAITRDWALANIGFFEVFNPMVQPVKANVESCSPGVVVAVIDTGIDYTHPDLKDSVWVNRGETGAWEPPADLAAKGISCRDRSCNGFDDDGNGYIDDVVGWDFVHDVPLPFDTHGHGTHIAGIISGGAANGVGTAGVCPSVSIMALKYYDNSGAGYNNLANTVRAIHYAVRNGAQIINYSGGGADPAVSERTAVEEAQRKGILFVAAAGNDGHNNDQFKYFPASYGLDNIVGVASVNKQNQLLPSSNWGKSVHLAAPGLMILSSLPDGRFGTMSGTSQATAFVTGTAALLASQTKGREVDYRTLKRWLVRGAKQLRAAETKRLSAGLLSVPRALQVAQEDIRRAAIAERPAVSAPEVAVKPGSRGTAVK